MFFTVLNIEEDIDFGCEERPEGTPVMAIVTLLDEAGNRSVHKFPDKELEQEQIQPKDQVVVNEKGVLCKVFCPESRFSTK